MNKIIIDNLGHDNVNRKAINHLTKYCSYCQKYGHSLGRFKFTLRKDLNLNHSVSPKYITHDASRNFISKEFQQ